MIGETILNRYKIESELGKGGMGIVYRAQDTLLSRAVAIKFLNIEGVGTEGKARLLQEARAAAQLNHPNIVSVYDAGETEGNPFIVMELVRGTTLRKTKKPTLSNAILMTQQICLALDHAHTNGIIHRDLKPENIVITNTQTLKLMDFGLAHSMDDTHLTEDGTLMGTLTYMAPELLQGQPASVQSDLYALGIILYEFLVGRQPFQGDIGTIIGEQLFGQVTPPSKFSDAIPGWVDELVLSLLSKRPESRPSSARMLLNILEEKIEPPITATQRLIPRPRHNLPAQSTSFIGREKEIREIMEALVSNRLVTLTGSGGSGKTRLALQTASNLLERFSDGVWLVELAPITDPDLIAHTILSAIGVGEQAGRGPIDVLTTYLQDRQTLLVLDNCEHLIEASAKLTDALLKSAPELRILASSREALAVKGELAYPVPSLSLPDRKHLPDIEQLAQYESVRLFADRATLVAPHFHVDTTNASFIAQICSRLDGIPFALELAAARVKVLSVEQIAQRLDDRFRLLSGGVRTALPRQQTLRGTIDWSYNLLSEEEKTIFRKLAVFTGGWTFDSVDSVCDNADMLNLLTHLVDKSLVAVDVEHGDEPRYHLLETIRQYAREKLVEHGESEPIRNRHMQYFCGLVAHIEPGLRGPDQVALLDRLESELDNVRAALEWALDHDISAGLRLASGLKWFWHLRNHWSEGASWLDRLLNIRSEQYSPDALSESDALHRAKALLALAFLAGTLGEMQRPMLCIQESIALCQKLDETDSTPLMAESYLYMSLGILANGETDQAKFLAEKSLELYQQCGNKFGVAEVQGHVLTILELQSGEFEKARSLAESNLALRKELGDKDGVAYALCNAGVVAVYQGDYERARRLFFAAKEASQEARSDYMLGGSLGNLAVIYLFQRDMDLARGYILKLVKLAQEKSNAMHKVMSICLLALFCFEQQQFRKFAHLYGFLNNENSLAIYLYYFSILQTAIRKNAAVARAEVGEEVFSQAELEGKGQTTEQILAYALEGIDE